MTEVMPDPSIDFEPPSYLTKMTESNHNYRWNVLLTCALSIANATAAYAAEPVQFSLQIRPILSEHCFHCHGPDETHREAGLRLDSMESATSTADGRAAIVPGKPGESELWKRIVSEDANELMPPPSTHKSIKPEQRQLIRDWIEQGAKWGEHWAFEIPVARALPSSESKDAWALSPIDAWVLAKMKQHDLQPAPKADALTLCRRIHLDLIGVPPTFERTEQFVVEHQVDPAASVDRLVQELQDRPEFGEHWARMWLDLARYADTKGYEKDLGRDMWPFRDWVIAAINQDMPLDQWTTEMLAGDLLPQATESQKIATAFHRATLSNDEGGTDDEEFRIAAVKDRVDTTIQVWMGLTMGCAKCHTHKYDPISIEDYYRFYAIFNQTEDADRYDDEPRLHLPSFEQQKRLLEAEARRGTLQVAVRNARDQNVEIENKRWTIPAVVSVSSEQGSELVVQPDGSVIASGKRPDTDIYMLDLELPAGTYRTLRVEALTTIAGGVPSSLSPNQTEMVGRNPADPNFVLSEFTVNRLESSDKQGGQSIQFTAAKASTEQDGWPVPKIYDGKKETGWAIGAKKNEPHWAILVLEQPIVLEQPARFRVSLSQQFGGGLLMQRVRISFADRSLEESYPMESEAMSQAKMAMVQLEAELQKLREAVPKLPVLRELPSDKQRVTKVHNRGSFLDQTSTVQPALLPAFAIATTKSATGIPTRLDVASWLMSPENPLTARVMANRIWAQLFGRGIVETEEDFGAQGSLPTHPELLDYLSLEYRESHRWSLKKLLRQMMQSNTYQQAFVLDDHRKAVDPRNIYYSRGPRLRLSAEAIRDNALAIAGLLSNKRGGPPVMPPQPDGLWRSTYNGAKWVNSTGDDRYRRGIYTFWKRTTPYPSMETFDSSTREVCQIRRITTNTPLQALVTMNDPVYTEAANAFANRILTHATTTSDRIDLAFRLAANRNAEAPEIERLSKLLQTAMDYFEKNADVAKQSITQAHFERPGTYSDIELAAWSTVTSVILNLDEVLTK